MSSRLALQKELEELMGSRNVYFQPPENFKMNYPCIRYERSTKNPTYADNEKYLVKERYVITLITRDPDSELPLKLYTHFKYCSSDRSYVADNLYHDVFTLVY